MTTPWDSCCLGSVELSGVSCTCDVLAEQRTMSNPFVRTPNPTTEEEVHLAEHFLQGMPFGAISSLSRSVGRDDQSMAWGGH